MNDSTMARFAGGSGLAATGLLVAAPGIGGQPGMAVWLAGFVLVVASLAPLGSWLRTEAPSGPAALMVAGAVAALGLQLAAAAVGWTAKGLALSSPVHEPMHSVEQALFAASLLPLGIGLAGAAWAMTGGARSVPRWVAIATGATSLVLISNGMVIGTETLPGLALFMLWLATFNARLLAVTRRSASVVQPVPAPSGP